MGGGGAGASLCPRALSGRALAPRRHNTCTRTRILTHTVVYVMHWCAGNTARRRGWRAAPDGAHRAWCVMHERPLARAGRARLDGQESSTRALRPTVSSCAARRGRQTPARARGPRIRIGASCGVLSLVCARDVCVASSSLLFPLLVLHCPHTCTGTLVLTYVHTGMHACAADGDAGLPEVQRGVAIDPQGQHGCTPWTAPRPRGRDVRGWTARNSRHAP